VTISCCGHRNSCFMSVQLGRIFDSVMSTIERGSPATQSLYSTQFPRWRILGTLIRYDVNKQKEAGSLPSFAPFGPGMIPPPDSAIWDHGVWQGFATLQYTCRDATLCGKRGCENPGTILCMCETVKYCSENCKSKWVLLVPPSFEQLLTILTEMRRTIS
jgi:hypothetical protein